MPASATSRIVSSLMFPEASKRTLKISREKGVYINHELKEEEFFSIENNIIKVFYDIFLDKYFFSSLTFQENKKEIVFEKNITIDATNTYLKVFFENNPLLLRKVIAHTSEGVVTISFNEHNYNYVFEKDFFTFVPMYLD